MTSQHTTAKNEAIELLPCPFCGSDGELSPHWEQHAGCSNARCEANLANVSILTWNTRRSAIEHTRLREALEQWKCEKCRGNKGTSIIVSDGRVWRECTACKGSGLNPIAQNALSTKENENV